MNRPVESVVLILQSTAAGGMETHVVDLAAEYRERGLRTVVIVPGGEAFDGVAARVASAGATLERLTTEARNGRVAQLRAWWRLVRLLRGARADVVHLHTGGATGGLGVTATARLFTNATIAITEHDVPAEHPGRPQRLARLALDRSAHLVIAVSRRNARIRRQRLGVRSRNFAAVLNGVPVPEDDRCQRSSNRTAIRAGTAIPDDAVVLGSLVRLAEGKGLDTLLRAFAIVRGAASCKLLLVGDGPLRLELEVLARELGISGDVLFAGNQSQPLPYLHAMDAFVLPVPAGSMSIALLEAMAAGLPPVITFCGPEEAVIPGETGLGASPNDPAALAEALRALVTNPGLRAELGAAAAAHVARNFSTRRVADDLLEAYRDARAGRISARLSADGPPNPRPGELQRPPAETRTASP